MVVVQLSCNEGAKVSVKDGGWSKCRHSGPPGCEWRMQLLIVCPLRGLFEQNVGNNARKEGSVISEGGVLSILGHVGVGNRN